MIGVTRVQDFNIGDMITWQLEQIRKRQPMLGRVLNIRLGVDSRAAYFNSDAWKRVMPKSKVMGLNLEWPENLAPWCSFAEDRQTLLFPNGIEHQPRVKATILRELAEELKDGMVMRHQMAGQDVPHIPQEIVDYASGKIFSRDGWAYAVCQPVEQVIVLANVISKAFGSSGTFLDIRGVPLQGQHPALMVGFKKKEQAAHIVHGMMVFAGSEGNREIPKPWLNAA